MSESGRRKFPVLNVVWEGFRRPLAAAIVMTTAAFLLIQLNSEKSAFDRKQNAPIVLVGTNTDTPGGQEAKRVLVGKLAETVAKLQANADDFDYSDAFYGIASGVSYQSFKTLDELIPKFQEAAHQQKTKALQLIRDSKAINHDNRELLSANRKQAEKELESKFPKGAVSTNVYQFLRTNAASSFAIPLSKAYPDLKKGSRETRELDELKSALGKEFAKNSEVLDAQAEEINGKLRSTGDNFQRLNLHVFDQLTDRTKLTAIYKEAAPSSWISLLLDEKKGLGSMFKVIWIALMGAVLFALLYLILIPLKHMFFWTTASDTFTDQINKILDRKDSVVAPAIAKGLLVTAAAVGAVGTATAISPSISAEKDNDVLAAARTRDIANTNSIPTGGGSSRGPNGGVNNTDLSRLEGNIATLTTYVGNLESAISGLVPGETAVPNQSFVDSVDALNRQFTQAFGTPLPANGSTIFANLDKLTKDQTALRDNLDGFKSNEFRSLADLIGSRDKPKDPGSIYGRFGTVSDRLDALAGTQSQISSSIENVRSRVGDPADPPESKTFFGTANAMSDEVASIRRDQLGTSGRNLFTQTRTLFSPERYRVSRAAVLEIDRKYGERYPALVARLRQMIGTEEYSVSQLEAGLKQGVPFDETWQMAKNEIFRYMRISRF